MLTPATPLVDNNNNVDRRGLFDSPTLISSDGISTKPAFAPASKDFAYDVVSKVNKVENAAAALCALRLFADGDDNENVSSSPPPVTSNYIDNTTTAAVEITAANEQHAVDSLLDLIGNTTIAPPSSFHNVQENIDVESGLANARHVDTLGVAGQASIGMNLLAQAFDKVETKQASAGSTNDAASTFWSLEERALPPGGIRLPHPFNHQLANPITDDGEFAVGAIVNVKTRGETTTGWVRGPDEKRENRWCVAFPGGYKNSFKKEKLQLVESEDQVCLRLSHD